jgi:enterochelin esterase family protein
MRAGWKCFALAVCAAGWLRGQAIAPGSTVERSIAAGETHRFEIQAKARDLVTFDFEGRGADVVITIVKAGGGLNRAFSSALGERQAAHFFADADGGQRVTVTVRGDKGPGQYKIANVKLMPESEREKLAGEEPADLSPRIRALRTELRAGKAGAAEAFWAEIAKSGGPLVEPAENDAANRLVTFLWHGTAGTRNVYLYWPPQSFDRPEDYFLARLENSDVWYKTLRVDHRLRTYYTLAVDTPRFTHESMGKISGVLQASSQRDPLNPKGWGEDPRDPDLVEHRGSSKLELTDAPPQPWGVKTAGTAEGKQEKHRFESALLKNGRSITVYTPAGYSREARPYGLVFLFDEASYLTNPIPGPVILDNLIAAQRIPPVVAVFIGNGPGNARSRELPCNPDFAEFLNGELVPWVRRLYNVTDDPRHTVIGGSSYGGLAAAYAGLRHPETFGNILSQSGSYWWTPPKDPANPSSFDASLEPQWLIERYIESPRLPLRFYLDAGSQEVDLSGNGGSILVPTRNFRNVLRAKGYDVHYQEFYGGHDYVSWKGTLADGLILLVR